MRSRPTNTRTRAAVAPPGGARTGAALLALCACLLAGCGSSGSTRTSSPPRASAAERLLGETFAGGRRVRSAHVEVSFQVSQPRAKGASALFSLALSGAFEVSGRRLPDVAFTLAIDNYGRRSRTGLIAAGGRLFIRTGGHWYATDAGTAAALRAGFGAAGGPGGPLASLLGPLVKGAGAWLTQPRIVGPSMREGASTVTVAAGVDVPALLRAIGGPGGSATAMLGAKLAAALGRAVRDPRVLVETGATDHILRRVTATAALVKAPGDPVLAAGSASKLTAMLALSALGRPVRISAPAHPLPAGALAEALRRSGGVSVSSSSLPR
jgi:hypothetical protein